MGMDVSGLNPTIIGDEPVFPKDWDKLSQKAKDCYMELDKEFHDDNPGVYFRANVWSWRPIHMMILATNDIFNLGISADTLDGMGYNSGHGIKDKEGCIKLANKMEILVNKMKEENVLKFGFNMGMWTLRGSSMIELSEEELEILNEEYPNNQLITELPIKLATRDESIDVYPSHTTEIDHVEEFILFLRNCGGFEVY